LFIVQVYMLVQSLWFLWRGSYIYILFFRQLSILTQGKVVLPERNHSISQLFVYTHVRVHITIKHKPRLVVTCYSSPDMDWTTTPRVVREVFYNYCNWHVISKIPCAIIFTLRVHKDLSFSYMSATFYTCNPFRYCNRSVPTLGFTACENGWKTFRALVANSVLYICMTYNWSWTNCTNDIQLSLQCLRT